MHFLITAGGTREYIDPVRFISNASSGKMGYAIAKAAVQAGHKVTLISPSHMQPPIGVDFVGVDSAKEMFETVKKLFQKCDCLVMAAAVSDYTPIRPSKAKIKKDCSELTVKLKPTKDILAWAGKNKKKNQIVIGFALEDKALRQNAEKKLKEKNLDMIIANTPDAIAAEKSTVHIKTSDSKWLKIENKDKIIIAKKILAMINNI
ncbi:MAG: phosphopantothenoylcysteine decarboxylase domain-containing protein [Planctomycetota bacterium]|jgi:phosphopantothenoylcysteine decarboxylase/phosphopantothenate--cysteine ligase